jgi:hypothetical protein
MVRRFRIYFIYPKSENLILYIPQLFKRRYQDSDGITNYPAREWEQLLRPEDWPLGSEESDMPDDHAEETWECCGEEVRKRRSCRRDLGMLWGGGEKKTITRKRRGNAVGRR